MDSDHVKGDYITARLKNQIEYYDQKAIKNQKCHKIWTMVIYILSALIPVVTLMSELDSIVIRVVIALLGSGIALITNVAGLYKFHELWIKYRTAAERLQAEKVMFENQIPPYDNEAAIALKILVTNCESIMAVEREDWKKTQLSTYSVQSEKKVSSSTES